MTIALGRQISVFVLKKAVQGRPLSLGQHYYLLGEMLNLQVSSLKLLICHQPKQPLNSDWDTA